MKLEIEYLTKINKETTDTLQRQIKTNKFEISSKIKNEQSLFFD